MAAWWITNISDKNVCLADLAITVPAGQSWNLLDAKHFTFNIEQLALSRAEGSINAKRDKIKVGITHKQIHKIDGPELSKQPIQTRKRSAIKVEETNYDEDEWMFTDEDYASEMSQDYD